MMFIQLIFWICLGALVHSYVAYPFFLHLIILLKGKKQFNAYSQTDPLPNISLLMAAYNEEAVIEKKIRSIFNTNYPKNQIEVLIGSDNSDDSTNYLLKQLSKEFPQLHITLFDKRHGKISIINQLSDWAKGDIIFITDANVLLQENTLFEAIKFFADSEIGLVDTHMKNYGQKKDGISFQETSYISREVYIKQLESRAFGTMIGPFGGCYAIRKELFTKVPSNFTVDDFFICMNVLNQKKKTINNLNAVVYEDVSNSLSIEFKRKIRIAIGNFQNLKYFKNMLRNPFSAIGFSFFSHKVLRWLGPFFILGTFITNLLLINHSAFYGWLFIAQLFLTFSPIADFILKKFGLHIVLLRFATHFYTMNLSLLIGFIKSIKGVKSNVWRPTKRFQE